VCLQLQKSLAGRAQTVEAVLDAIDNGLQLESAGGTNTTDDWVPEPANKSEVFECLRSTFLNGTESVERQVYSQWMEDGISVLSPLYQCSRRAND
jgi:hypothetical protein